MRQIQKTKGGGGKLLHYGLSSVSSRETAPVTVLYCNGLPTQASHPASVEAGEETFIGRHRQRRFALDTASPPRFFHKENRRGQRGPRAVQRQTNLSGLLHHKPFFPPTMTLPALARVAAAPARNWAAPLASTGLRHSGILSSPLPSLSPRHQQQQQQQSQPIRLPQSRHASSDYLVKVRAKERAKAKAAAPKKRKNYRTWDMKDAIQFSLCDAMRYNPFFCTIYAFSLFFLFICILGFFCCGNLGLIF